MTSPSNSLSSSSPMSSRALPNPTLRNSETVNPVRRSFAGSPFMKPSIIPSSRGLNPKTQVNSPLDHPQRNSSTYCRDLDEKENGKDLNPRIGRVRSPTITNCTKNFMSPTISASSKIAMSPKKKILVERNDLVRTSLSSSDLKSTSLNSVNSSEAIQPTSVDLKPDDCNSIETALDSTDLRPALRASSSIPKASKTVSFIDSATKSSGFSEKTMFEDADLVNLDYRFKISPASSPSSCQIIAPLDEDPSMPPYDPKTNYLSPRPQFLHYRPNPRMERYLHEEEDGKRVEGSLLFDSFSDTEGTEETQSDSSQKSDEVSSNGIDRKDKQEEEEADHIKSEPCLIDNNNSNGNSVGRGNSQPSFRNIYKITALILLLCFACSSVFHSTPLVNRVRHDESSFLMKNTNQSEIYQFVKSRYTVLAENLQVWFNNAAAFVHGLISNFEEENHQLSPVRYFNLSALQEDISVDGYFVFYETHERMDDFLSERTSEIMVESEVLEEDDLLQDIVKLEEEVEENSEIMENPDEREQEHEESERHGSLESGLIDEDELLQNGVELEKEEHSEIMEDPERSCEEEEHQESKRHESLEEELSEENGKSESEMVETITTVQERPERVEESEQGSLELDSEENGKSESEMVETITTVQERPERVEESEQGSLELDSTGSLSSEMDSLSNVNPPRSETMMSKQVILLILLPPLMAAVIFAHSRRVKFTQIPSSRNWLTEGGVDMAGESCPSELSSFQKRSSYVKGGRGGGSNGKNHRRESLSSSMCTDSASYGSFTAYEKISTKHVIGDLEEEMVTPVRRSSRIKSKLRVGLDPVTDLDCQIDSSEARQIVLSLVRHLIW